MKKERIEEIKEKINSVFLAKKLKSRVSEVISATQLYRFKVEMTNFEDPKKFLRLRQDLEVFLGNKNVNVIIDGGIFIEYPKENIKPIKAPKSTIKKYNQIINIGKGIDGKNIEIDLKSLPHILISGETGSGKSMMLQSIINELSLAGNVINIIDTKRVSFNDLKDSLKARGEDIKVFVDAESGAHVADMLVRQMDKRYKKLVKIGKKTVYDLTEEEIEKHELKPKILVIDELADTFADKLYGELIEDYCSSLAVKGRGAGIHLILATQRADSKIFSPLIKANMSNRIAFKVATSSNSRVAIDISGAELLNGKGDFYLRQGANLIRGQGYKNEL